jgi:8-oxo-dGTP pyrophosphatase MutT (NUDIX family)
MTITHAHLVVRRDTNGDDEVLIAQRNIYLPPSDRYEHATIAHHAAQYVIPGGKLAPGESAADAARRELYEDTGVDVAAASVRPLCELGDRSFFEVLNVPGLELGRVNAALARGQARSAKTNNMTWVSIDRAETWFGMKMEYQHLPWVTAQIARAVEAGFGREHIGPRVNESGEAFVQVMRILRGTGGTVAMRPVRG